MSKNVDEVVVKVPQGTKQITIKIENPPANENCSKGLRKICD